MTAPPSLESKQVLIVDDSAEMRLLVRRMLTRMKVTQLAEAADGGQALDRLREAAVDLVICDWNMAGMSGMELFDHVRSFRPGLPFVMLTGQLDAKSEAAAKQAGIAAYLVKPVSSDDFKAKITALLLGTGGA
jgi:two-component system chemotaxis response regulator CheY